MSAISKLRDMFLGDDPDVEGTGAVALPSPVVSGVGVVAPGDPEAAAREALGAAQVVLADLTARRDSTVKTIEALVGERSKVGRGLASGESSDEDFAAVESQLAASLARRDGLDALLLEAEDARRTAQLALNEAERPRREAERSERVEVLRLAAEEAVGALYRSYRECCAATSKVADALEALAGFDQNAANCIHVRTLNYSTDPLLTLTTAGWTPRAPGLYTVLERRIIPLVPPKGR